MSEHWSDPIFFKLLGSIEIPKWVFGRDLAILQFEQQELANPKGELVGIAFWAGRRRYLWEKKWWAEYPLNSKFEIIRLNEKMSLATDEEFEILIKVLEWIEKFQKSPPPESEYKERRTSLGWSASWIKGKPALNVFMASKGPKRITRVIYPAV